LDSDAIEAALRPSVRMFEAIERLGDDDIDFFADTQSPSGSVRKTTDRHSREIESPNPGHFSRKEIKQTYSDQDLPRFEGNGDMKYGILSNTMTTAMDRTELFMKTRDAPQEPPKEQTQPKKQPQWQSPDSSYSSHCLHEHNNRNLGKIKEVSFEHSSARPSIRTSQRLPTFELSHTKDFVFQCIPVPKLNRAKKPVLVKPIEVDRKRVDLDIDKLKRMYVGRNNGTIEETRERSTKGSRINQADNASIANTDGETYSLKPKYLGAEEEPHKPFKKSKYKLFQKTDSVRSLERLKKGSNPILKVFGSKSCPKSVKNSDASETFSLSIYEYGRKSANNSHLQRVHSPKEANASSFAKCGFVKIKDKLREHTQTSNKKTLKSKSVLKNLGERKTCPGNMFELSKKGTVDKKQILTKSNLFRDPSIKNSGSRLHKATPSFDFSPQSHFWKGRGSTNLVH
jgi:hypothetical protein